MSPRLRRYGSTTSHHEPNERSIDVPCYLRMRCLVDVVGLYLDPPEHALVLCCDEKSQMPALDRTQPGLPIKKGRCGMMTHDYVRNGATALFAALNG